MFCSKCGYKMLDSYSFCPSCGKAINDNQKTNPLAIRLKCEECGGAMEMDKNRPIIMCPYCGSKKLIPESDNVKIQRIKSDMNIELEKERTKRHIELEKEHIRKETELGIKRAEKETELEKERIRKEVALGEKLAEKKAKEMQHRTTTLKTRITIIVIITITAIAIVLIASLLFNHMIPIQTGGLLLSGLSLVLIAAFIILLFSIGWRNIIAIIAILFVLFILSMYSK